MGAETHKFITQKFHKNIKPKMYKVKRKEKETKQKALTKPYEKKNLKLPTSSFCLHSLFLRREHAILSSL